MINLQLEMEIVDNSSTRAQAILETVDGFLLRPALRDKFFREKAKFRHQSSKPSLRHMIHMSRELVDTSGFDPSTNPWATPTIGKDALGSYFDQNPQARMAPIFKKRLTEAAEPKGKDKKPQKKGPPAFLKNTQKKSAPPDQETILAKGRDQDASDQDTLQQQQQAALQQQGLTPGMMSPQDAMQGGMPPEVPELPRDLRKDPMWAGNRSAQITQGLQTYSQKVVDRYDVSKDPMVDNPGPRTFSNRMRMQQAKWGDATSRPLQNNRAMQNQQGSR